MKLNIQWGGIWRNSLYMLLIACVPTGSQASQAVCRVSFRSSIVSTEYGDVPLDEYFTAQKKSTGATVLLLHGSAGLLSKSPTEASFDNLGENLLACNNFHVFIPHYMSISHIASAIDPEVIRAEAPRWVAAVREVLKEIKKRDRHLVMYGYGDSLGGFMLLKLASGSDQFRKLSVVSAGLTPTENIQLDRFPPVLIQQGIEDKTVPKSMAEDLSRALASRTRQHKLIEYPGLGHNLYFESQGAVARATVEFFQDK